MLALCYLLFKNKSNQQLVLISFASFLYFIISPIYDVPLLAIDRTSLVGKITSIPHQDGNHFSFLMKTTDNVKIQVHYYMKTRNEKNELTSLKPGMYCSFEGAFQLPSSSTNFNGFDYQQYLASRNIYYVFRPNDVSLKNCSNEKLNVLDRFKRLRQEGMKVVKDHFPDPSKGIVTALVFGDKNEIDVDTLNMYQSLGVIHVLAVSGLHVGLVSTCLFFFFIRIGFTRERSVDLLMILLPLYCIIAGAAPSVIRASTMCMVVLLSVKYKQRISPLDSISGTCLLLLIVNPQYVFQLGFQLSFIVSFCLIVSSNIYEQYCTNKISKLVVITLIAQIVSFPVIVSHFYEFSPFSLIINLLYIPFIALFILPLSFLTILLFFVSPPGATALLYLHNGLMGLAHHLLQVIDQIPFSTITFGKPPEILIVIYYLSIGYYLLKVEQKSKGQLFSGLLVFLVLLFHWFHPYLSPYGEVTIIDVGQGDSIYIELPRRKAVYLVDTGGSIDFKQEEWKRRMRTFDVGEDVVVPFLKSKGVRKIDKLILTHGHFDHIGGGFALLDEIKVDNLLYGVGPIETEVEKHLLEEFQKRGTEIQFVKEGKYWIVKDSIFYILSPKGNEQSANDRSIVIYSSIGGVTWLFTGDLEEEGELRIVSTYDNLPVDILKVGHHGSITSTTEQLLEHIKPRVAIISVGENNRYNHPHPDVIRRLENANIVTFRTDKNGSITYRFSRRGGSFKTLIE